MLTPVHNGSQAVFRECATRLVAAGYSAVPIAAGTKFPEGPDCIGWTRFCTTPPTHAEIEHFARVMPDAGVGLPNGLTVAVDFDNDQALKAVGPLMAWTPVGKVGAKGLTLIYRQNAAHPEKSCKFKGKRDSTGYRPMLIEILSTGNQTVLPPTIHPDTGKPYHWYRPWRDGDAVALWDIRLADLPEAQAGLAGIIHSTLVAAGLMDDPKAVAAAQAERRARQPQIKAEWENNRHRFVPWLEKRLTAQVASLVGLTDDRHDNLYRAACAMAPYVAAGLIEEDTVRTALFQVCESNGFFDRNKKVQTSTYKEFDRQFDRAMLWGESQPLAPLDERYFRDMPKVVAPAPPPPPPVDQPAGDTDKLKGDYKSYWAHLPSHRYCYMPTREFYSVETVDNLLPSIQTGVNPDTLKPIISKPSKLLDLHKAVHQAIWCPGYNPIIEGWLNLDGAWVQSPGHRILNLYRPPRLASGNPMKARRWVEHIEKVFPKDAAFILDWFAQRAQQPGVKNNVALVLGGKQGLGKDTMIEPLKRAVGPWNFVEVSPETIIKSEFNDYLQSVVLRVSEAKDLGAGDRFALYEKMKTVIAAPPDVHRVNAKHMKAIAVMNMNGVIYTTNHKVGGIYISSDDRRHYVAWSDLTQYDFSQDYWQDIWDWYEAGGINDCIAYLMQRDISAYNPKASPPRTDAFWEMVEANQSQETSDVADVIEALNRPTAITLNTITCHLHVNSNPRLMDWLNDSKNRKAFAHIMEDLDYSMFRNRDDKQRGRYRVGNRYVTVYADRKKTPVEQFNAVQVLLSKMRDNVVVAFPGVPMTR